MKKLIALTLCLFMILICGCSKTNENVSNNDSVATQSNESEQNDSKKEVTFSDEDKMNIQLIYDDCEDWGLDLNAYDIGYGTDKDKIVKINKIGFYKISLEDGFFVSFFEKNNIDIKHIKDKVIFITSRYIDSDTQEGTNYYIDTEHQKLGMIHDFSENDRVTIDNIYKDTAENGTDWNSNATDEEKHQAIEDAYKKYLESENLSEN